MFTVKPVSIPLNSAIYQHLPGAQFFDAFETTLARPEQSALEIYLAMIARTPSWAACLMDIRNRVAKRAGLTTVQGIGPDAPVKPASAYQVGDRIDIFTVAALTDNEVNLAATDKHVDT